MKQEARKHTEKKTRRLEWIFFIAARSFSKKRSKSRASSLLSIFEIGAGVLALTVIIAVMNGFQLGFIESILEISSYYIRIDNFPRADIERKSAFYKAPGVLSVTPFIETQGIISGAGSVGQSAVVLRCMEQSAYFEDAGMREHLVFLGGSFNLEEKNALIIGSELSSRLNVDVGDTVEFLSISNLFSQTEEGDDADFVVSGIFRTGYYEYDSSWGFINLETAAALKDTNGTCTLGIKLKDRYQDTIAAAKIAGILGAFALGGAAGESGAKISLWRDYNKAFFNALRTEKLLMFALVGLIFIVVAINIYQAQRRTVLERSEEIGLLRAVGASDFSVRWVFALKGLIIGLGGATGGMALALLISTHIQEFFSFIEMIVTLIIQAAYTITSGLFFNGGDFAVFSKRIFYIQEYTARLILHEVLLIYFFAVVSAFLAAWFASRRISKIKPAEVLRYE